MYLLQWHRAVETRYVNACIREIKMLTTRQIEAAMSKIKLNKWEVCDFTVGNSPHLSSVYFSRLLFFLYCLFCVIM